MSSEFYSSSLSRNLVRTGGAGYRKTPRCVYSWAKPKKRLSAWTTIGGTDRLFGLSDFSRQTRMARSLLSAGRIRLTNPAVEKNPLSGPPSP